MALQIVKRLLEDLHTNDINYCHWKSNEHIAASVHADTDLDMLFDVSQKQQVIAILTSNHFHLFEAVWYKKYNGIVDYIGFDKETGKIVHVHTHFHLDLGEVGIKSYHLPWEQLILERKIFNENYRIYTSPPVVEYLLLVVRTAFKQDPINYRSNRRIINDFNREAKWLYPQVDLKYLKPISESVLNHEMADLIEQIRVKEHYDKRLFGALKKQLKPHFAKNRVLTPQRVALLKTLHLLKSVKLRIDKLLGVKGRTRRRSLPHQGVIVSLMGADGAGKSTQTKLITKELAKKVDVLFMYMGSGKGDKSFQRRIMSFLFSLGSSATKSGGETKPQNATGKKKKLSGKSVFKQMVVSAMAVSLAFERKSRLKRIERERKRGGIVICDRYPQTAIFGHNDGPLLYDNINSANLILKKMAGYELSCYALAKQVFPDLVVKLTGDIETLYARRPELTKEEINKKQEGIAELEFGKETTIVKLGIDKPKSAIKGEILHAISDQIEKKAGAAENIRVKV